MLMVIIYYVGNNKYLFNWIGASLIMLCSLNSSHIDNVYAHDVSTYDTHKLCK